MESAESLEQGPDPVSALAAELALWEGERPKLFWRDDDLTRGGVNLDRFLALSDRWGIPIAFAAIPTKLSHNAASAIRSSRVCRIAMHGYAHRNHAPADAPRSEYPAGRVEGEVLNELRVARQLIKEKGRERYLNMFVPPWGGFDASYDALLGRSGIVCFSGGAQSARHDGVALQHDCQLMTEHGQRPLDLPVLIRRLTRNLTLRRTGHIPSLKPIGMMTHHGIFTLDLDAALEEVLNLFQAHGFAFSHFEDVDAAMITARDSVTDSTRMLHDPRAQESSALVPRNAIAGELVKPTVPTVEQGFVGLAHMLGEIAKTSVISVLRYVHMEEMVSHLPAGARVLSAGCGRGLVELALAIRYPEHQWLAVDLDPARYRHAVGNMEDFDVKNISFGQQDLNRLDLPYLGQRDAIMVSEVMVYLDDPARTVSELSQLLTPTATLTSVEPYVREGDQASLEKLRNHTKSPHGAFNHAQMRSFAGSLELVSHYSCYSNKVSQLLAALWNQMSATGNWGLLDLLYSIARLDLHGQLSDQRSVATAVKIVVRRPARG